MIFNGTPLTPLQTSNIIVLPGPTVAAMCTLSLDTVPVAGTPTYFTLSARDVFGNVQVYSEWSQFGVVATSLLYALLFLIVAQFCVLTSLFLHATLRNAAVSVTCSIQNTTLAGVYNIDCPLTLSGPYHLVGSYLGQSAFTSSDVVDLVPGNITASTSGFDSTTTSGQTKGVAGQVTTFTVQGRDSSQNKITYSQVYQVSITPASGGSQIVPLLLNNLAIETAGLTQYTYNISVAGSYYLSVKINGEDVSGSPSHMIVHSGEFLCNILLRNNH